MAISFSIAHVNTRRIALMRTFAVSGKSALRFRRTRMAFAVMRLSGKSPNLFFSTPSWHLTTNVLRFGSSNLKSVEAKNFRQSRRYVKGVGRAGLNSLGYYLAVSLAPCKCSCRDHGYLSAATCNATIGSSHWDDYGATDGSQRCFVRTALLSYSPVQYWPIAIRVSAK